MLARLRFPLLISCLLAVVFLISAAMQRAGADTSGLEVGVNCSKNVNSDPANCAQIGAKLARVEFDISNSATSLDALVSAFASRGIRVQLLAGFYARVPSTSESQNLRSWALRFGPGGSFWQGRSDGNLAVQNIEFGNETSYAYQYGDNWDSPSYGARAGAYAQRARDAATALQGTGVGLLVQADDANTGSAVWVNQMFAAVPDLDDRVAGWIVHPYGPDGFARLDRLTSQLAGVGASSSVGYFITEWGLASDNGRTLSDNYGYPRDLTYSQAATTMNDAFAQWQSRVGSRLKQVIIYQNADLQSSGASSDREGYFGITKRDGSDKGAYTTAVRAKLGASSTPIAAANTPPVAQASAAPSSGVAPLNVAYSSNGSSDPDGRITQYAWDLDGDGAFDDSAAQYPSTTYSTATTVAARLKVTDDDGASCRFAAGDGDGQRCDASLRHHRSRAGQAGDGVEQRGLRVGGPRERQRRQRRHPLELVVRRQPVVAGGPRNREGRQRRRDCLLRVGVAVRLHDLDIDRRLQLGRGRERHAQRKRRKDEVSDVRRADGTLRARHGRRARDDVRDLDHRGEGLRHERLDDDVSASDDDHPASDDDHPASDDDHPASDDNHAAAVGDGGARQGQACECLELGEGRLVRPGDGERRQLLDAVELGLPRQRVVAGRPRSRARRLERHAHVQPVGLAEDVHHRHVTGRQELEDRCERVAVVRRDENQLVRGCGGSLPPRHGRHARHDERHVDRGRQGVRHLVGAAPSPTPTAPPAAPTPVASAPTPPPPVAPAPTPVAPPPPTTAVDRRAGEGEAGECLVVRERSVVRAVRRERRGHEHAMELALPRQRVVAGRPRSAARELTSVQVTFNKWAWPTKYTVSVSLDGSNWTTVATETPGTWGTTTSSFGKTSAQYVRITGVTRATVNGISIEDAKVFGTE